MSDSYEVVLSNTSWSDVSQSNIVGFISNTGKSRILLWQASSQPDDSFTGGHPVDAVEDINFSLINNETIWGLSIQAAETITVTPGI